MFGPYPNAGEVDRMTTFTTYPFYRLEKFSNLCQELSYETQQGKAVTIKYMKKLLKYTPLKDSPEVNGLFGLLAQTIFAMHEARVNEGGSTPSQTRSRSSLCSSQISSNTDKSDVPPKLTKYTIFKDKDTYKIFKEEMDLFRKLRTPPLREQTLNEQLATEELYTALSERTIQQTIHAAVCEGIKHLVDLAYQCALDNGIKYDIEAVEYGSDVLTASIANRLYNPYIGSNSPKLVALSGGRVYTSKINRHIDGVCSAMNLVKDMKIKQVVSSDNGTLAFGWTRPFFAAPKVYGFYAPFNTRYLC